MQINNHQVDTINGVVPLGQNQYSTNTFDNAAVFGTAGNNQMQLANFYPSDDQNLINIESSTKQSTLASGNKKNQLSLQSNKSTSKLPTPAGYTLSTH